MRAALRPPSSGFTLIELLVVIAIISVLAVAFLPNVFGASVEGERTETMARIEFLAQAAKAFERHQGGFYPPDDFKSRDREQKVMGKDNGINTGIESLVLFLCQKRSGQDSIADHEDWLVNTDNDQNTVEIPLLQRRALMEVADAWGTPLYYAVDQTGGYAKVQRIQRGDDTVPVRAHNNPETGRPAGPGRFQLISAGPDGEFGNDDDLVYPRTK